MQERTITIKETGEVSAAPDEIHILLGLTAQKQDYSETMALAGAQHETLVAALTACAIAREEIKTTGFHVDAVHENGRGENGEYASRFAGYRCAHQLRVVLPLELHRLGMVLDAIAASNVQPEINLRFTVRNMQPLRDEVLRRAAKNAREKAELLSVAGGVRLNELVNIDYASDTHDAYSPATVSGLARVMSVAVMPEDVRLSSTVTFTWALA